MARNPQSGQTEREAVHEEEEEVQRDDGVDEAGEQAARGDGVFFDELGEVVQPACCWGKGGVRSFGVWDGFLGGGGERMGGRGNGEGGGGIPIARVRKEKPPRRPR